MLSSCPPRLTPHPLLSPPRPTRTLLSLQVGLCEVMGEELGKAARDVSRPRLQSLLELALRTSSVGQVGWWGAVVGVVGCGGGRGWVGVIWCTCRTPDSKHELGAGPGLSLQGGR